MNVVPVRLMRCASRNSEYKLFRGANTFIPGLNDGYPDPSDTSREILCLGGTLTSGPGPLACGNANPGKS